MHILLLVVTTVCGASNSSISRHLDVAAGTTVDRQGSGEGLQELVKSHGRSDELPQSHAIREKVNSMNCTAVFIDIDPTHVHPHPHR